MIISKVGNTALCIAAQNFHAQIMSLLLKNGADANVRNNVYINNLNDFIHNILHSFLLAL